MRWLEILVMALTGALAALLAAVLIRKKQERRIAHVLAIILCWSVLNAISREYLTPRIRAWSADREFDAAIENVAVYRLLAKYDSPSLERLKDLAHAAALRGLPPSAIAGQARLVITESAYRCIPNASDASVIAMVSVVVKELRLLRSAGSNLCYTFLFPKGQPFLTLNQYIDARTSEEGGATLAEVIRTAYEQPMNTSGPGSADADLETIVRSLEAESPGYVDILGQAESPTIDKDKVCDATVRLYESVLRLPSARAAAVLRHMFARA